MQCHSYGNIVAYHYLFHDGYFETFKHISESSKGLTDDDAMPKYQTLQLGKCLSVLAIILPAKQRETQQNVPFKVRFSYITTLYCNNVYRHKVIMNLEISVFNMISLIIETLFPTKWAKKNIKTQLLFLHASYFQIC